MAIWLLREQGLQTSACVAVHAIFAGEVLAAAGPGRAASCNTIGHASNAIDVWPAMAAAVSELLVNQDWRPAGRVRKK